jgi:hypothetical protein
VSATAHPRRDSGHAGDAAPGRRGSHALTAAIVVSALLCGCGGSAPTLSRAQLLARADAICLQVNRQAAAAIAASRAPSPSEAARQAFIRTTEASLPLSDRGLAELRALRPPPAMAADWRRFLTDVQSEDRGAHQLLEAARGSDLRRGESVQVTMQAAAADLQQLTARVGFAVCGRPQ